MSVANVIPMPAEDPGIVRSFLRCHILVRVYDGDCDAWLAQLATRGADPGEERFVRWMRTQLRRDPALLANIRRMVDATPFWQGAEA